LSRYPVVTLATTVFLTCLYYLCVSLPCSYSSYYCLPNLFILLIFDRSARLLPWARSLFPFCLLT